MKVKLTDGAPRSKAEAVVVVSKNGNTLEVGLEGTVAPVVVEFYEGKVRLRVYGENAIKPVFMTDLTAVPVPAAEAPKLLPVETAKPVQAPANETTDEELAAFDAA